MPRFILSYRPVAQVLALILLTSAFHIYFENKVLSVHKTGLSRANEIDDSFYFKLQSPNDLLDWLVVNIDTPGGNLIGLLQQFLHVEHGAEAERRQSCYKSKDLAVCYGGHFYTHNSCVDAAANTKEKEKCATIPIWYHNDKLPLNAYQIQRISGPGSFLKDRFIRALGTEPVCLPLILAGAALESYGVAIELGTFVGYSSRCIGAGLNSTENENIFYGYDTFNGSKNFVAIAGFMHWVDKYNPEFTQENDNFLWLWDLVMRDVYPTAKGIAGRINKDTLNPSVWDNKPIAMISIDSAKDHEILITQMGGILELKKGTIFVLMDFNYVPSLIKAVYGCYRQFLFPVYSSFCTGEHMIFVVTETFHLTESLHRCMAYLGKDMHGRLPSQPNLDIMRKQIEIDANFLDRLLTPKPQIDQIDDQEKCLINTLQSALTDHPWDWISFRNRYISR